ncbi:beta strand repeat-containing protein, partial [Planktothrix agardhii]|uniref:beta strand repeat-containing protein n=1 Tax=Planktothrix agardhii TaxID=1160 RepID=UPI001BE0A9B3
SGYANFKFTVNDGTLDSVAANTITIDVTAVNYAPVLDNTNFTYTLTTINEDDSTSIGDVIKDIIPSGSIKENTNISLTGVAYSSVTTADFDNDGDTDILLTGGDSSGNPISKIYSNNGSGGFSENTNISLTGVYTSSVTTADFDKDGDTDILLTGWYGSGRISKIYSNNGSGGFSENTNVSLTGVSFSSVTTADFDKDGYTDILLTGFDSSGNPISKIYSNNGSGGFSENTNVSLTGVAGSSVTTADFDKDGDTDILLTGFDSSFSGISKIYSNNGSGGFSENTNISLTGVGISSVTTADFDKDGDTDILLTGFDSSNKPISKIYSNNGSGGFSENTNISLTGVGISSVTTADFDKDGDTDILLTGLDSSNKPISKIYSNNGSGGFSENTNISLTGVAYSSVTTADFDKDGDTDILLTGQDSSGNPISKIYSNNGSGGFSENTNISLTRVSSSSVTTADFDKDGDTDILLTGYDSSGNPISKIYSNNGSGGFSENTNISLTGVSFSSVTTADFDNDGDTDILLTGGDSSNNRISKIYSNNGSGGFSENTNISLTSVDRSSVTTADFDKDGDTDILLTGRDSSSNRIRKIYSNNGSGGFSENTNVSLTGVEFSSVTTADFDNDGDTDILLTGRDSSNNPISKIYSNTLNPPTFSSFAGPVDTTNEDTEVELTFAEFATQGNEADNGGTVDAFVVKAVSSGTLRIGSDATSATAWVAGSNDTIDATKKAYWTPDANVNGTVNAVQVVAKDNDGLQSPTPVTAQVTVTAVNYAPVLDNTNFTYTLTTINEDDSTSIGDVIKDIIPSGSIKENTNISLTGVAYSSVTT